MELSTFFDMGAVKTEVKELPVIEVTSNPPFLFLEGMGHIIKHVCPICGAVKEFVKIDRPFPRNLEFDLDLLKENVIIFSREYTSRSGKHSITGLSPMVMENVNLVPSELVRYVDIKVRIPWITINSAGYSVVGNPRNDIKQNITEEKISVCWECVAKTVEKDPDFVQGHLYIKKVENLIPEIKVKLNRFTVKIENKFFNHEFSRGELFDRQFPHGGPELRFFKTDDHTAIKSEDHPYIYLEAGEYLMYHPKPSD